MAGARQNGIGLLLAAALLLGAAGEMLAQSTTAGSSPAVQSVESIQSLGALSGRLTDLYGRSLDGVTVLLRNDATGAEARTTTGKKGAYRFSGLSAGNYTLEATSEPLGRGRLEGIVLAAGHEERLVTAMGFTALAEEASASEPKLSLILPSRSLSGIDFSERQE